MKPKSLFRLSLLAIPALALSLNAGSLEAASISFAGADITTAAHWRTAATIKPLDADGDNIFGTAGYRTFGGGAGAFSALPSFATVSGLAPSQYPGNGSYVSFDNPNNPAQLVLSGVIYGQPAAGVDADFVQITLSAPIHFRLGVITDNADVAAISPNNLHVRQTVGGVADSGLIASPNRPTPELGSYYFFDIAGNAGDVFVVSGTSAPGFPSNGIYGVTFDASPVPEPATWLTGAVLAAVAGSGCARRFRKA